MPLGKKLSIAKLLIILTATFFQRADGWGISIGEILQPMGLFRPEQLVEIQQKNEATFLQLDKPLSKLLQVLRDNGDNVNLYFEYSLIRAYLKKIESEMSDATLPHAGDMTFDHYVTLLPYLNDFVAKTELFIGFIQHINKEAKGRISVEIFGKLPNYVKLKDYCLNSLDNIKAGYLGQSIVEEKDDRAIEKELMISPDVRRELTAFLEIEKRLGEEYTRFKQLEEQKRLQEQNRRAYEEERRKIEEQRKQYQEGQKQKRDQEWQSVTQEGQIYTKAQTQKREEVVRQKELQREMMMRQRELRSKQAYEQERQRIAEQRKQYEERQGQKREQGKQLPQVLEEAGVKTEYDYQQVLKYLELQQENEKK